jgi:predicted pyridoxine 5'-phosphate oxidase superfamily flavin-nucleotide-binding protein
MGAYFSAITGEQAELIRASRVFFVASVDPTLTKGPHGIGPVNVSPRGGETLHVLSPTRVAFLDHPGSGNETARHCAAGGPVTLMVCSFEGENAAIVRLYGKASAIPIAESPLAAALLQDSPDSRRRQVIEVLIESTMTSCGYGVPVMDFVRDRAAGDRGRKYKPKA